MRPHSTYYTDASTDRSPIQAPGVNPTLLPGWLRRRRSHAVVSIHNDCPCVCCVVMRRMWKTGMESLFDCIGAKGVQLVHTGVPVIDVGGSSLSDFICHNKKHKIGRHALRQSPERDVAGTLTPRLLLVVLPFEATVF